MCAVTPPRRRDLNLLRDHVEQREASLEVRNDPAMMLWREGTRVCGAIVSDMLLGFLVGVRRSSVAVAETGVRWWMT